MSSRPLHTRTKAITHPLRLEALEDRRLPSIIPLTTTLDSGFGTLRQAILDANAHPGLDTITFSIGSGAQTISPLSPLPDSTGPVIIDGTTQPGYGGTPIIQLDGSQAGSAVGLLIDGGNSVVRGLVISHFQSDSPRFDGKGGDLLENCYVGTDFSGTVAEGKGGGVAVFSSANTVGVTTGAARNLISGNGASGVVIAGAIDGKGSHNLVEGNYIGTNASGTAAIPNAADGVFLLNGANRNTIGGTTSGTHNLISGNVGGTLKLALQKGVKPPVGSVLSIITGLHSGNFTGLPEGSTITLHGETYKISYSGGSVTLTRVS
jgi:hypothetical protein